MLGRLFERRLQPMPGTDMAAPEELNPYPVRIELQCEPHQVLEHRAEL
jgi:hypothetical protein